MEIVHEHKLISELSQVITYKFVAVMTALGTLLPVNGLYLIEGGYC